MKKYIALLRGINVGGKNLIPMQALITEFEKLGAKDIATYIQSGNVVFSGSASLAKQLPEQLPKAVQAAFGFTPQLLILEPKALAEAVNKNPFSAQDPKALHYYFLAELPKDPNMEGLDTACSASEAYTLDGQICYLSAPDGIGRSKLAAKMEKCLGVPTTARNARTVGKLIQMADD